MQARDESVKFSVTGHACAARLLGGEGGTGVRRISLNFRAAD